MKRKLRLSGSTCGALAAATVLAAAGLARAVDSVEQQIAAVKELEAAYPGIGIQFDQERVHIVYGMQMGGGGTAKASADAWLSQYGAALGGLGSTFFEDWEATFTVNANFTVFTYQQFISGVPVEYGTVKVLVLNGGSNPVVYAAGTVALAPSAGFP